MARLLINKHLMSYNVTIWRKHAAIIAQYSICLTWQLAGEVGAQRSAKMYGLFLWRHQRQRITTLSGGSVKAENLYRNNSVKTYLQKHLLIVSHEGGGRRYHQNSEKQLAKTTLINIIMKKTTDGVNGAGRRRQQVGRKKKKKNGGMRAGACITLHMPCSLPPVLLLRRRK